jgi:aldose 1-epimerase
MYPWVNRLDPLEITSSPPVKINPDWLDGNGVALHGLFAACEREIVESGSNFVILKPTNMEKLREKNNFLKQIPKFIESFILLEGSLSVMTEFLYEEDGESLGFGYGYHPYIQLDDLGINDARIQTNMSHFIQVDEKLLPIKGPNAQYQVKELKELLNDGEITKDLNLDHCFVRKNEENESFFSIIFKEQGLEVCLNDSIEMLLKKEMQFQEVIKGKEKIPLQYFQVYTPPDRKRIAVEPQSSGANAYFIGKEELRSLKNKDSGKYGIFNIILKGT